MNKLFQENYQIRPPWSSEQIRALEEHQRNGRIHPYTCGNNHDGDRNLIPTVNGWICPNCDYTQNWAWDPTKGLAN